MRTWIKLILRDSKTLSPLPDGSDSAVRDRTYCYDWGELEPAQQISLFYIWKVCRFCPQQRNCPTISNIPRSSWWKQENIQFQGDPSNCLSSAGLRDGTIASWSAELDSNGSNFVGCPVSRSWCPDLSNHSIMTRQYLSSLELGQGEQDPASLAWPLPLPWPAPGQDKLSAARRNPNNKYFPNIEQSRLQD